MKRRDFIKTLGAAAAAPLALVTPTAAPAAGVITAIDKEAGTLTMSAGMSWRDVYSEGDYLFVQGDSDHPRFHGLYSWLPTSTPHGETFYRAMED